MTVERFIKPLLQKDNMLKSSIQAGVLVEQ